MGVRRVDHSTEAAQAVRDAIARGLESIGDAAEGYARALVPVDTGRLRDSIAHEVEDGTVYLSADTEYAPFVELGTRRAAAKPFLIPAMEGHRSEWLGMLSEEISKI